MWIIINKKILLKEGIKMVLQKYRFKLKLVF